MLRDTARERVDEIGHKGPWTVTVYPGLGEGIEALVDTTLKWTVLEEEFAPLSSSSSIGENNAILTYRDQQLFGRDMYDFVCYDPGQCGTYMAYFRTNN